MGAREDRLNADQCRVDLGVAQMQVDQLRNAIRDALHLGIAGDVSAAGRVLLAAMVGELGVSKLASTPQEGQP